MHRWHLNSTVKRMLKGMKNPELSWVSSATRSNLTRGKSMPTLVGNLFNVELADYPDNFRRVPLVLVVSKPNF